MKRAAVWMAIGLAPAAAAQGGGASGQEATDGTMRARVAEIERQIDAWSSSENCELSERRAEQIRELVYDVLADADTRASLLDNAVHAGWDDGFYIADADGKFRLNINGQLQIRSVNNFQDDDPEIDTHRSGFENRRTKVMLTGHVFEPGWRYNITGAYENDGGGMVLDDGYIERLLGNGWSLKVGQFREPFMREALVESQFQLAVDRSLVNEYFNQGRSQGVELAYDADKFRFKGMYSDGFDTDNTPALMYDTEWAFGARIEVLLAGEWEQFEDFTSWKDDECAAMLGGAVHYQSDEYGTPAGPEEKTFTWTVDGSVEFGGANLFAYVVGRHLDEAAADQYGAVVQGGVFVTEQMEFFARYEWGDLDSLAEDDINVITVGFNKYFHGHQLKLTTDLGYAFDTIDEEFESTEVGWREDALGTDGQVVIRCQLQLLF